MTNYPHSYIHAKRYGRHDLPVPERATAAAAGYDLRVCSLAIVRPGETRRLLTGFAIEIPDGYVGLIRDRSGTASRGLTTRAGVIDSDYRGEIAVIVVNESEDPIRIEPGERIAQLLMLPIITPTIIESDYLTDTTRGANGFGHTGTD